jgi:hypothetical protein
MRDTISAEQLEKKLAGESHTLSAWFASHEFQYSSETDRHTYFRCRRCFHVISYDALTFKIENLKLTECN